MFGSLSDNSLVTQICHPAAYLVGIDKLGITYGSGFITYIFHHLVTVHLHLLLIPLPAHE